MASKDPNSRAGHTVPSGMLSMSRCKVRDPARQTTKSTGRSAIFTNRSTTGT